MRKAIKYFKEWNDWRKRNVNRKFYKFLVLIRIAKSPTFETTRNTENYGRMIARIFDE